MAELPAKEKKVLEGLVKGVKVPKRKSKDKVVVGMIGLVGSGKSMVAEKFARELQAVLISGDEVRLALRKKKAGFDHVRAIVFSLAEYVLAQDGNVVIDSDFADSGKRNDLKKITKDGSAELYFIRTVVGHDVLIGRIMTDRYGSKATDLFVGSYTAWTGAKKPAVVKMREMWRRTPRHYTWKRDGGGQWVEKTIPQVYTSVDTTKPAAATKKAVDIAKRIGR